MATNKNITMKQFNGVDYDTLYPKTKVEQVEGAYTQQQILADSTKALYGLGNGAVPDDVLALLSRFHSGLSNEYIWKKIVINIVTGAERVIVGGIPNTEILTFYDTVSLSTSGEILLNGPNSFQAQNAPSGKYYNHGTQGLFLVTRKSVNSTTTLYGKPISTDQEIAGYVNSPDPNAYPPAVSDGYTYTALGKLGAKAQIETGSYTGTGKYGISNKNSLTFNFEPQIIVISESQNGGCYAIILCNSNYGATFAITDNTYTGSYKLNVSKNVNSVSWYQSTKHEYQMNDTKSYKYVAIG